MSEEPNCDQPQSSGDTHTSSLPSQPRSVRSEDILRGETEVMIVHGGVVYRLRQTKSGKLILNK